MTDHETGAAEALKARVAEIQAANDAALAGFAREGVNVANDVLTRQRLAILLDHLLGDMDNPTRLEYELRCQEQFAAMIADIRSQIARAKLTQGVQLAPPNGQQPRHG